MRVAIGAQDSARFWYGLGSVCVTGETIKQANPSQSTANETAAQAVPIPTTVDRVAELFGTTDKTVRSWIRAGLKTLRAGSKGSGNGALLDLSECIKWYLSDNALDVAKTRLATAQSDKYEMENALRRGELVDVEVVRGAIADHIVAARAKLLAMPTKLGPQLTNVSDARIIAIRIKTEVSAALAELASYEPARLAETSGGAVGTTAGPNSEPVGGQAPAPKQRKQRGTRSMEH
jgi:phage terminase Nu1 subunit (DNA packaging protein)